MLVSDTLYPHPLSVTPRWLIGMVVLAGCLLAPRAPAQGFDVNSFTAFTDMRVGTGEPVYWYCVGTVYSYPEGKALMRMEGIDTAKRWRDPAEPAVVKQLSRKTFFYRDLTSDAVLNAFNGSPLAPIEYPYQFITYALHGDRVQTLVEQGRAPRLQKIGPGDGIQSRRVRGGFVFTAPLFLDFPLPDGKRYQAFENYDFFVASGTAVDPATHRLSWLRFGDLPGAGQTVMHLVSWRVDRYADLPAPMRRYLESQAPLWIKPPADIAEIRALQAPLPAPASGAARP